jgi:hypothetical protein
MRNNKTKSIVMLGLGLGLIPFQNAGASLMTEEKAALERLVTAGEISLTPNGQLLVSPSAYRILKKVAPVPQDQLLNYLEQQFEANPKLIEISLREAVL